LASPIEGRADESLMGQGNDADYWLRCHNILMTHL